MDTERALQQVRACGGPSPAFSKNWDQLTEEELMAMARVLTPREVERKLMGEDIVIPSESCALNRLEVEAVILTGIMAEPHWSDEACELARNGFDRKCWIVREPVVERVQPLLFEDIFRPSVHVDLHGAVRHLILYHLPPLAMPLLFMKAARDAGRHGVAAYYFMTVVARLRVLKMVLTTKQDSMQPLTREERCVLGLLVHCMPKPGDGFQLAAPEGSLLH